MAQIPPQHHTNLVVPKKMNIMEDGSVEDTEVEDNNDRAGFKHRWEAQSLCCIKEIKGVSQMEKLLESS